jgi:amidase
LKAEAPPPAPPPKPFELEGLSIRELQARMESGQDSARSLVTKYLERIEALNARGPELRAVIEINPEAAALAEALDAERKSKGPRGPLHGIPILLKDNIETADKMSTTAGSLALEGSIAARDAGIAARLREAGAVLLGKANMSEWANFRSTRSTSGWSARGGQCRNPYALDRNPSGSSSGSAVAAAACFAAAAVGTETDGSIVSPASICSIVGIKPTLGLLSRGGIIPIAHSQDTAGPMARSVADAAILLGAMVGEDGRDALSREGAARGLRDYAGSLDPNGLKGARLGVARKKLFGQSAKVDKVIEEALSDLRKLGAELVDPVDIPTIGGFDDSELLVLLYEFKADLNAYLATLGPGARIKSLAELIAWNEANKDRELVFFGQELFEMANAKGPLSSKEYREALATSQKMSRAEGLDAALKNPRRRLDALVCPTGSLPWLIDPVNGDSGYFGASTTPAVAGYPHITVPAGYASGLPVGLSFIGLPFSEPSLIRLAFAYEQATRHRVAPGFPVTADLALKK